MNYSVVIPERNEMENFRRTAENIQATQKNCNNIIHISDTVGNGTSYSRHLGVMKAENDIIITCDAHMRFQPGALDDMAEYLASHPLALACLRCHHNKDMVFTDNPYNGADLYWKQVEPNNNRVLSAKWRTDSALGDIPAVMGACYCFNRNAYLQMGSPWSLGVAWGGDEETISIAMRLIGGNVVLLPGECSHQYRHSSGYKVTEADIIGVWYNRIRNLYYLPVHVNTAVALQRYVLDNPDAAARKKQIIALLDRKMHDITAANAILIKNQKVDFNQYSEQWIIKESPVKAKNTAPKTAAVAVKAPATTTTTHHVITNPPKSAPLPVSYDFGIKCRHCDHISNKHKVTNTYTQSRRYLCDQCKRPFIVMQRFERNPMLSI